MLPVPSGIGRLDLPLLPPAASGPAIAQPGAFSGLYDRMLTDAERAGATPALPTSMEVRPIIMPAVSLAEPFQASPEFPGAVGADGLRVPGTGKSEGVGPDPFSFLAPLREGMSHASRLSADAEKLANEAAIGGDVDLHDVMISAEKASVAMQLTLQVRNKLVEAYQDVMRMQI